MENVLLLLVVVLLCILNVCIRALFNKPLFKTQKNAPLSSYHILHSVDLPGNEQMRLISFTGSPLYGIMKLKTDQQMDRNFGNNGVQYIDPSMLEHYQLRDGKTFHELYPLPALTTNTVDFPKSVGTKFSKEMGIKKILTLRKTKSSARKTGVILAVH